MSKPERPLRLRTTLSNVCAIVVKRTTDHNGNSVYIATCGSEKRIHRYDPSLNRDDNMMAAADLLLLEGEEECIRGAMLDSNTFAFIHTTK